MREVKVPNLEIAVPPGSAFACQTPPMMPKAHFLSAVVAPRGYGKGLITTAFLEKLKAIDRLIPVYIHYFLLLSLIPQTTNLNLNLK